MFSCQINVGNIFVKSIESKSVSIKQEKVILPKLENKKEDDSRKSALVHMYN